MLIVNSTFINTITYYNNFNEFIEYHFYIKLNYIYNYWRLKNFKHNYLNISYKHNNNYKLLKIKNIYFKLNNKLIIDFINIKYYSIVILYHNLYKYNNLSNIFIFYNIFNYVYFKLCYWYFKSFYIFHLKYYNKLKLLKY